ncbi:MAG TPA: 50S ribosomal protein L32 [Clostridia bacterium]|nr:50S ribosomal protein L32 [Clostridia bacterium]
MAVPKRKISKQRGNKRFANWKLKPLNLVECPQCHNLMKSHAVCGSCGYYNGVPVVVKEAKKD